MPRWLTVNRRNVVVLVAVSIHLGGANTTCTPSSFAHAIDRARQAQTAAGPATSLVIEHVAVIAANGSPMLRDATIVIRDGRIAEIGGPGAASSPSNAQRVDATGKFVIPGLWDMHVHLFNNFLDDGSNNHAYFFPLMVANGIVGVRDMWTDAEDIAVARRWNEETESGRMVGPRVLVSSRVVDGDPPNGPHSLVVHNEVEGRQAVRTLKAAGSGFIKVYWFLNRESFFAIADESKKQGIAFAGHVPFAVSAAEASDSGQRTIEHMTGILEACSAKEDEWLKIDRKSSNPGRGAEMLRTYDDARCERLAHRFVKNGTWLVPTSINFIDPRESI